MFSVCMRADDFASAIEYEKYEIAGAVAWCMAPLVPDMDIWQYKHWEATDIQLLILSRRIAFKKLLLCGEIFRRSGGIIEAVYAASWFCS